jgi:predicted DCC family thiol-disulfide oxidoreductase YuxK
MIVVFDRAHAFFNRWVRSLVNRDQGELLRSAAATLAHGAFRRPWAEAGPVPYAAVRDHFLA